MGKQFENRIFLITGASRGLGRALTVALAAEGANVIALARTEETLAVTQEKAEAAGGRCLCIPFDLMNFDDYGKLFLALKDQVPHLDGIIHCAGSLNRCKPMQYIDVKGFRRMLDIHLTAPNMLTQSMLPLLKRAEGASIIFTTCDMVEKTQPNWHGYGMAKAAIPYAVAMWQAEQAEKTMRFNAINPGLMRTELMKRAYPGLDEKSIPLPEELVPAYLHLLSDDAREIRGETLNANTLMDSLNV